MTYINDSKATAPSATVIALESLRDKWAQIIAIVGGQKKSVDLAPLSASLLKAARTIICYGEAGPAFAEAIQKANYQSGVPATMVVRGVGEAVEVAASQGGPGDTVLFSPGAPSFDQYANFTERGKHFCELVSRVNSQAPPG